MPSIEQIQALLTNNPKDSFLRFALAKEYENKGNDSEARSIYEGILSDSPDYIGTYYHLAKTLERLDEPAKAFGIYTEGIKMATQLGEHHAKAELAGARLELGDEEDFE